MANKRVGYIVATDGPALVGTQAARLYKLTGYKSTAVLAAQGTYSQMRELADDLNGESDD